MLPSPYAWQSHHPRRPVPRDALVTEVVQHLRRGAATRIIGGRGMGKSVLLHQLEARLQREPGTRVVLVPGPPVEATVTGAVRDLADHLGIRDLATPRMDDLLERVLQGGVMRVVLLFDKADQYVELGGAAGEDAAFGRRWFNKLETTRQQYDTMFSLVLAGGLNLFYLERELGSDIVSRAEPCILAPFDPAEITELAGPFKEDGRPLDAACLETLRVLSGGSPALVTYGLERLWEIKAPSAQVLEQIFGLFRERHDSFIRSVQSSISQRGRLDAPWRVLKAVRQHAGSIPMQQLRDACAQQPGEQSTIDPEQALKLLRAAGLVRVDGAMQADPVLAWPIASIMNLPETPASTGEPIERLLQDVCAILVNLRRFARDFHDGNGLLQEKVFSSLIAVALRLLGWLEIEREAIQVAGFTDIKVRLPEPGLDGHAIIETKLWRSRGHNQGIQQQIDDYRIMESRHGIAVTLGTRDAAGWSEAYEQTCLAGRSFEQLPTPSELVGRWRVRATLADGKEWLTDHLLVQIPKRR